jgi:hypothetical protein
VKIVCPFCKGRLRTVYVRTAESGKYQFMAMGNYFHCMTDEMIFVPTNNLVVGPDGWTPKGHEFLGNAKRLVPETKSSRGPSPMHPHTATSAGKSRRSL